MSTAALASETGIARGAWPAPSLVLRSLDRAGFAGLASEWNALVEATRPEPFYRHEFIASFIANFVPAAPLKIVAARDGRGSLEAVLPLVSGRGALCGIPVRELASPTNVHSLRFDLVAEDPAAAEAVFQHLAADESWDVLRITDVPERGQAWRIYEAAERAGFPVGAWESQRSPYVSLPGSFDELTRGLRTKFKANLRRRRKRLAEKGTLAVTRVAGGALGERDLDECFELERSGWKGRQGSAASQSQAIRGFHFELLRNASFRERLSLHRLTIDSRPIAFHYGITTHGVYSLVMTSYDERFKEFSPGHLLTESVIEDCVARRLREFDFLGCDLPWKLEWTSSVRRHHWLFVFRNNRAGRLLRQIKFGWAPAARQWLQRWRPA